MSRNILIVEGENDKYFLEALLAHLHLQSMVEIASPVYRIDDFEYLEGLSAKALHEKLKILKRRIRKEDIAKIGIILDSDKRESLSADENEQKQFGIENRINLINTTLREADFDLQTALKQATFEFVDAHVEQVTVKIACYIMNVQGYGDLETVLRTIKAKASVCADCLGSWRECLGCHNKQIEQKYFDKFWLQIYFRYDCCRFDESNAWKNCTGEIAIKKSGTWNFDHPELRDLKQFLELFREC